MGDQCNSIWNAFTADDVGLLAYKNRPKQYLNVKISEPSSFRIIADSEKTDQRGNILQHLISPLDSFVVHFKSKGTNFFHPYSNASQHIKGSTSA